MDPLDELAAMFLTTSDSPDGPTDGATATALELLLVGHLPVRAGLWLTPYADAIATEQGPTALVRLDATEPMIQVFGARAKPNDEPPRNLREAIFQLSDTVRTWIVRPSSRASVADVLERGFGRAGAANRLTLLCGSNEAAVVNAYKVVKELAAVAETAGHEMPELGLAIAGSERRDAMRAAEQLNLTTRKYLRLEVPLVLCLPRMDATISGSSLRTFPGQTRPDLDEVVAWIEDGRSRIATAEPPRSGTPGETTLPSQSPIARLTREPWRIEPEPAPDREIDWEAGRQPALEAEVRGSNEPSDDPSDVRPEITVETGATPAAPRAASVERSLEPDVGPAATAAVPPSISTSPGPEMAPGQDPSFSPTEARTHTQVGPHVAPAADPPASGGPFPGPIEGTVRTETFRVNRVGMRAARECEMKEPVRPFEPDQSGLPVPLARYVPADDADPALPSSSSETSLEPIQPRCPGHERVELALDRRGRIHLLGFEDTLREMPVVETWTRSHREILALACPDKRIDPGARVVCHLFTDVPMKVADLHGSDYRLHLLAPVRVGDAQGWYAARLA